MGIVIALVVIGWILIAAFIMLFMYAAGKKSKELEENLMKGNDGNEEV